MLVADRQPHALQFLRQVFQQQRGNVVRLQEPFETLVLKEADFWRHDGDLEILVQQPNQMRHLRRGAANVRWNSKEVKIHLSILSSPFKSPLESVAAVYDRRLIERASRPLPGRDGAPRRPRREVAAQRGAWFARRAWFVPPALTRAGTSRRDVPTTTLNTYSASRRRLPFVSFLQSSVFEFLHSQFIVSAIPGTPVPVLTL